MKHKYQLLLFMTLLIIAGASSVFGQTMAPPPPQDGPPPRPGRPGGDPIRQLNLSPEQRDQIRLIREQNQEERASINQRVRDTNRALEEALDTDNPDEAVVEQRVREAALAQAAAMRMKTLSEVKIRRVLTQEQRTLLRTLRRQIHERRIERRIQGSEDSQQRREERSLRMRERRKNNGSMLPGREPQRRPPL